MVFNSQIFIFIFLPACLAGYYFLLYKQKGSWAGIWLIGMSLWFYAYYNPRLLLWISGSIFFNLLCLKGMKKWRKAALYLGVMGNLGLLFYCRYGNVLAVLGISFFTFQQISFLVDAYKGEVEEYGIGDYILFVLFFPKLVQGPIATHNELMPQLRNLGKIRFDGETFYRGLLLFVLGMAKKVLLADTLGGAVNYGYSNLQSLYTADALIVMLSYTLQIYFDFSGYCDMALGIGQMFGIRLPVNFRSPYKAGNIITFWKEWHITLSRFLTRYVYIPLGGNRKGQGRMYLNLLIVFLVSGIWHGAGMTFIIWGMMHGILYVITRMVQIYRRDKPVKSHRLLHVLSVAGTYLYVNITWVFFRAQSVSEAGTLLKTIGSMQWRKINHQLAACFNMDEFWYVIKVLRLDRWQYGHYILTVLFLTVSLLIVFFGKTALETAQRIKPRLINTLMFAVIFVWCVLSLSGVSTFLYFNF